MRIRRVLVGVVLVVGAIASIGSGSTKTVNNTPAPGSAGNAAAGSSGTTAVPASVAHVGAALNLKDQKGNAETVTLVKVVNPATGKDEFNTPTAGNKFVGVQLSIKNASAAAISPNILAEVTLIDSANQSYNPDFSSLSNCQEFATALSIAPGDTATGCVAFQVPTAATPAKVQYTPSSGFADGTGQWLIP
jgi:hypothetical protein